ncbi:MAG: VCBS repeat-containing protein [Deltaproteobacteria bacterium]|nr:VCBS repeat-containing protein [Deltaproteobacteria bacterium]
MLSCLAPCSDSSTCQPGFTCQPPPQGGTTSGPFVPTCEPCQTFICSGQCIDPGDRNNCGACGNTCGAFESCDDGRCTCHAPNVCGFACTCATNQTLCGDACVDLDVDPLHCGACGMSCDGGACVSGTCAAPPDAGSSQDAGTWFGPATQIGAAWEYVRLAIADIDGDGVPDVVASQSPDAGFVVFLGHGDGTFSAGQATQAPFADGLVVADFTGDGVPDVVTGAAYSASSLFTGFGDGGFGPPVTLAATGQPMAVADFDGDGRRDVLLADQFDSRILPGIAGGFGPPRDGPAGTYTTNDLAWTGALVGDFDGDGRADVLSAEQPVYFTQPTVDYASFGFVDGGFSDWSAVYDAFLGASGDLDGDGLADLVLFSSSDVVDACATHSLVTFLATPGRTFQLQSVLSLPGYPEHAVLADFNSDGKLDLALILQLGNTLDSEVVLLFGDGTGGFVLQPGVYPLGQLATDLQAADLNGDGKLDLVYFTALNPSGVGVLLAR